MLNRLVGNFTVAEDVAPKYFAEIIKWRNDPSNNRFLNQPFVLTMELQWKWYKKYLADDTQGLFVLIDKEKNIPFGTLGFTDYNASERTLIQGRALVGVDLYRASPELTEGYLLVNDYLYENFSIEMMYIHVVNENKKVISLNKRWGYSLNSSKIKFPKELSVNGLSQKEYLRSKEAYIHAREKITGILNCYKE